MAIIKEMVRIENLDIEIVSCPIIREKDGLAMSSRNQRLTDHQRSEAANIPKTLFQAKEKARYTEVENLRKWVIETINDSEILTVEYFEIVDAITLIPVNIWSANCTTVGCIAVKVGNIRLIDNIRFSEI